MIDEARREREKHKISDEDIFGETNPQDFIDESLREELERESKEEWISNDVY